LLLHVVHAITVCSTPLLTLVHSLFSRMRSRRVCPLILMRCVCRCCLLR
jgi:hypothetical protein